MRSHRCTNFRQKNGEILHYWTSILRQSMSKHILSSCTTFLLCSMLHLTPFEVSTKVYVRRRSSWRRKSCENIITGSIWIEIKTHMRALHLHALTKREINRLSEYFLFCRDPLHVIFQVTWTNESKVAVVTWSAGNIRAISKHIVVKSKQMQWVRICICSGKQFEDAFENQTNCTRVAMHIEGNLKKHLRRTVEEVKQMQYVWLCIISIEPFTESFDKTYRRQAKRMQPV